MLHARKTNNPLNPQAGRMGLFPNTDGEWTTVDEHGAQAPLVPEVPKQFSFLAITSAPFFDLMVSEITNPDDIEFTFTRVGVGLYKITCDKIGTYETSIFLQRAGSPEALFTYVSVSPGEAYINIYDVGLDPSDELYYYVLVLGLTT
jgi:hypothetical protein